MSEIKSNNSKWLLGILVAVLGIASPIIWDIYKSKSSLELRLTSSTSLVDESETSDLVLLYKDQRVVSPKKITFQLINNGRNSIVKRDIVSYPKVIFSSSNRILDVQIDRTSPEKIDAGILLFRRDTVEVQFDLLNSSDYIEFSIILDAINIEFDYDSRIVGIKSLQYLDNTSLDISNTKGKKWYYYLLILVFIILFYFVSAILIEMTNISTKKNKLKNGELTISRGKLPIEYIKSLDEFSFDNSKVNRFLIKYLMSLNQDEVISDEDYDLLVYNALESYDKDTYKVFAIFSFIGFLFIILIGWYLLNN